MSKRPIDGIAAIAAAVYRADRARMAELDIQDRRLREQIAEIESAEAELHKRQIAELDVARLGGADALWQRWIEGRRSAIMAERYALSAKRADLMSDLRLSFGRSTAADAAAAAARAADAKVRARRTDWDS